MHRFKSAENRFCISSTKLGKQGERGGGIRRGEDITPDNVTALMLDDEVKFNYFDT